MGDKSFFQKYVYDAGSEAEELSKDLKPRATARPVATARTASFQMGSVASPSPISETEVGGGKIKEKLVVKLQDKIKGTAYAQFQSLNTAMKAKIADPSTRLIAAGASLGVQNITKQAILDGANSALSFLDSEAQGFSNTVATDIQNLDSTFATRKGEIEAALKQKNADIVKISDDIQKLQQDKNQLEIDTASKKQKLELVKVEFNGVLGMLTQEIQTEIKDINQFMGV